MLLEGEKTVLLRSRPLRDYQGKELWVRETHGTKPPRDFKARIIGTIRFDDYIEYTDGEMFANDEHRHCFKPDSASAWKTTEKLYGWLVASKTLMPRPSAPVPRKGANDTHSLRVSERCQDPTVKVTDRKVRVRVHSKAKERQRVCSSNEHHAKREREAEAAVV